MDPILIRIDANTTDELKLLQPLAESMSVVQALAERDILYFRPSIEFTNGLLIEDDYSTQVHLRQDHVALLIQELANMAQLEIGGLAYKQRVGGLSTLPPMLPKQ